MSKVDSGLPNVDALSNVYVILDDLFFVCASTSNGFNLLDGVAPVCVLLNAGGWVDP